jgi:hypothetical protein
MHGTDEAQHEFQTLSREADASNSMFGDTLRNACERNGRAAEKFSLAVPDYNAVAHFIDPLMSEKDYVGTAIGRISRA